MKFSKAEWAAVALTAGVLALGAGRALFPSPAPEGYTVSVAHAPRAQEDPRVYLPAHTVDVNTATVQDLLTLPGMGEARAKAIVADREDRGPFSDPEDVTRVPGIGPSAYAQMAPYITASAPEREVCP